MSNLPNFRFTLISNLPVIPSLGQIGANWIDFGDAGAPWTNSAGKIKNVNNASVTNLLYQPVRFVPGKRYILVMYFQTVNDCIIEIAHGGIDQYIYRLEATGGAAQQLLSCDFFAYPNTLQQLQIAVRHPTGVGSIDITLSAFLLQEVDSLIRQIAPGGWKSLAKIATRLVGYWGFIEDLEGSIEVVGDDLQWLRSYLITTPDKRFDCLVEIERDDMPGHFAKYYRGMIDTLSIVGVGIGSNKEGYTYRASIPFLKEDAWSRFTSYLKTPIDMFAFKGVHTLDCIDGRSMQSIHPVDTSSIPRLAYKFKGIAKAGQKFSLAPDDNVYLGFGDTVFENDGFDIYSGVSKADTLKLPHGGFRNIQGTVTVNFSSNPAALIVVQALVNDTGTWVNLVSGVAQAINVTEAYLTAGRSGYPIRVLNTSNNTQAILTITSDSTLQITNAQVEFDIIPTGQTPLSYLKAYTARILGDYDNLVVPPFEDAIFSQVIDPDIVGAFKNPPPKYFESPSVAYALGNFYSGGTINWQHLSGTNQASVNVVTAPSNVLLIRMVTTFLVAGVLRTWTSYITKGLWRMEMSLAAGGVMLEIVGIVDHQTDVLATIMPGAGNTIIDFNVNTYYEAFGVRVIGVGTVTMNSILFSYAPSNTYTRGRYYLNTLCTGLSMQTNSSLLTPPLTNSFKEFNIVLDGLLKIFGLGLEPRLNTKGQTQLYIDEQRMFFTGEYTSGGVVYAEHYEVKMDFDIIRDNVAVGGPARQERNIDQNSSCSKAAYSSTFITTKQTGDIEFLVNLNSALMLNQEIANDDIVLIDLVSRNRGDNPRFRTNNGLTISGSDSPRQLNWLHSEGRIMRRNLDIISGMGSQVFNLIGGVASTRVVVDYPPDLQGPLADSDLIFSAPKFTPWVIEFETSMTEDKYNELFTNRFNKIPVDVEGQIRAIYIKSMRHNPASSKAFITGWMVDTGDFNLDFSSDFDNQFIPILI